MNILYYFCAYDTPMYHWQNVHFLDELERMGHQITILNPLMCENPEAANNALLAKIKQEPFDLVFTNVCNPALLFKETLKEIKSTGVPSLCFRADNLIIPYHDKELAPYFTLMWLTSIETEHLYKKWGCKTVFAPYAANPYTFTFNPTNTIRRLCFIGTPYGSRTKMINSLADSGVDMDVFCKKTGTESVKQFEVKYEAPTFSPLFTRLNRFRFPEGRKLMLGALVHKLKGNKEIALRDSVNLLNRVTFGEMSQAYSNYAISLASTSTGHTDVLKNPLKVINLRNFEIPMSGGIEICKYCPELADYFEADKEIVFYESDEELIDKTLFYTQKATDTEILTIKKNARKRAESDHTWTRRFDLIFTELGINTK